MKHFNATNLQELREQYKKLSFQHHPDISGYDSTAIMQEINNQYDELSKQFAAGTKFETSENDFSELFKQKIDILIRIKNIEIEIIGNWLWVTGETKPVKELLKEMKFMFSPKKIAWYFKNYTYHKKNKEIEDLDGIRNIFGSSKIKKEDNTKMGVLA